MNSNAGLMNLILLIVFILAIYFLMIRPQRKRDKEVKEMRAGIKVGDEVITIGGIVGKVVKVKEDNVTLAVGSDKVKIEFVKSAIGQVKKSSAGNGSGSKKNKEQEDEKEPEREMPKPDKNKKIRPKKLDSKHEDSKEEKDDKKSEKKDADEKAE